MHSPLLATLTHARLRVEQGDLKAAREILQELLVADPANGEARALLDSLSQRAEVAHAEPQEEPLPKRQPGDAESLAAAFGALRPQEGSERDAKIRRLKEWADRLEGQSAPGEAPKRDSRDD